MEKPPSNFDSFILPKIKGGRKNAMLSNAYHKKLSRFFNIFYFMGIIANLCCSNFLRDKDTNMRLSIFL